MGTSNLFIFLKNFLNRGGFDRVHLPIYDLLQGYPCPILS